MFEQVSAKEVQKITSDVEDLKTTLKIDPELEKIGGKYQVHYEGYSHNEFVCGYLMMISEEEFEIVKARQQSGKGRGF